jgi:hypothetical protein
MDGRSSAFRDIDGRSSVVALEIGVGKAVCTPVHAWPALHNLVEEKVTL